MTEKKGWFTRIFSPKGSGCCEVRIEEIKDEEKGKTIKAEEAETDQDGADGTVTDSNKSDTKKKSISGA